MHRFFIPSSWIQGNEVTVAGPQAHQIARVLRMEPGDTIVVLDNSGWEIETQLTFVDPNAVRGDVVRRRLSSSEPRTKISVYQGALKSNRFEYALQKGTELGIVEFVPLISDRCVTSDLESLEGKRRRWELIIQEAAEQCHRSRKPALRPVMLFAQVCEQVHHSAGMSLLLWEGEKRTSLRDLLRGKGTGDSQGQSRAASATPFSVNLVVGPEGGFTTEEVGIARRYGLVPVGLGPRVLRAETAAVVAAAAILYELGDLQ